MKLRLSFLFLPVLLAALALAQATAPAQHATPHSATSQPAVPAGKIWADLMDGNKRFVAGKPRAKALVGQREELAKGQHPKAMVLSCSDSRVPANQIVGLMAGDMFVHRNVANVVVHTDLNCLSAIQFAVDALGVENVIICGHYGCGGVLAALQDSRLGLIDNWLRHVQDVQAKHRSEIDALETESERHRRLCELNVIEQVTSVSQTTIVRDAWARGQSLSVHGWIYDIADGLLRDLGVTVEAA